MNTVAEVGESRCAKIAYRFEAGLLPRICQNNMALPISIMQPGCRCCRKQLAWAGDDRERVARVIDHIANIDCLGAEALRRQRASLERW